mgnify:CR=1 FL=1
MKQVLQNMKNGKTIIANVPIPTCGPNHILVQTMYSLISPGTEKMLISFSKKNLLGKALDQPERVKEVITKAKLDGIGATIDAVNYKLSDLMPMGYSNVGKIIDLSETAIAKGFKLGDFVVSLSLIHI